MQEKIATPSTTKAIIDRYNIHPSRGLGQNFLIDGNILDKLLSAADLQKDDNIIEIGPGLGALTQAILDNLDQGCLITIEKDKQLSGVLSELLSTANITGSLEIISGDALDIEWSEFLKEKGLTDSRVKVMANLPYYITSPLIMNLLESKFNFEKMVFMVQKEVAERMEADPGSKAFGSLTVAVQFYSQVRIVHQVPPTVFWPRPDVDSAIVALTPHSEQKYKVEDRELFFKVVKSIFQQRRKNIKNSLSKSAVIDLDKQVVLEALEAAGIDRRIRGEKLSIEQMASLSYYIGEQL